MKAENTKRMTREEIKNRTGESRWGKLIMDEHLENKNNTKKNSRRKIT